MHACCSVMRSICSRSLNTGLAVILAMMHSWIYLPDVKPGSP